MIKTLIAVVSAAALAVVAPVAAPAASAPVSQGVPEPTLIARPTPITSVTSLPSVYWITAGCATGGFGTLTVHDHTAYLPASVTLCTTYRAKFSFAVVAFLPDQPSSLATANNLRPYAETGAAEVVASVDLEPGYPRPTVGVCLMRTTDTRIACERIDTGADGQTTGTPIAVDDPLVAKTVNYNGDLLPMPPDPFCATCLQLI